MIKFNENTHLEYNQLSWTYVNTIPIVLPVGFTMTKL